MSGPFAAPDDETPAAPPPGEAASAPQAIETVPGMTLLTGPKGDVYNVKDEDVQKELAAGARPATDAEYFKASSGALSKPIAGALGLAQGASFDYGIPTELAALKAVGADHFAEGLRRGMSAAKEAESGVYTGSELAGSLVPALLGAPEGAATAGESLLARAFARAAAAAPRAAFEGGAFGVGHQLTEDALGDHASTAEKLLASAEGGVVFGALLGAGFAAGGGALSDAAKALLGKVANAGEGKLAAKAAEVAEGEQAPLAERLRGAAEEQAFKATGAKTAATERLGATGAEQAQEVRRLGRVLLDEGIVTPTATKQEMAQRVEAKAEEAWKQLHELRAPLDKATARPSLHNILIEADKDIIQPLTGRTLAELRDGVQPNAGSLYGDLEAKPVLDAISRLESRAGESPSFDTLFKLRRDLDDYLTKAYARGPGPRPPGEDALIKFRSIVENEYMRAGEEAAKEVGTDFAAKYRIAKGLYSDMKTVEGILRKEVPREVANRSISLTDTIAGAHGIGTAIQAVLSGHPLGALAAAAPLVNKAIRTYGNQMAAHVLDRASTLSAVQKVAAKVDTTVRDAARGFIKGGAKGRSSSSVTAPKVTAETAARLREAVANPEAFRAHVEGMVAQSGLHDSAPNVSQALASSAVRAATYLASKSPSSPPPQGLALSPQPPRPKSAQEMARFQDIVDAVNDPMSVVSDLKKGRLNRDKIDALKNVYPQIYTQLQGELRGAIRDDEPQLTDNQLNQLSLLFGTPFTARMRPEVIRGFTQAFAQGANPQGKASGQPAPNAPRRPLSRDGSSFATALDKVEAPNGRT